MLIYALKNKPSVVDALQIHVALSAVSVEKVAVKETSVLFNDNKAKNPKYSSLVVVQPTCNSVFYGPYPAI